MRAGALLHWWTGARSLRCRCGNGRNLRQIPRLLRTRSGLRYLG